MGDGQLVMPPKLPLIQFVLFFPTMLRLKQDRAVKDLLQHNALKGVRRNLPHCGFAETKREIVGAGKILQTPSLFENSGLPFAALLN
jgi:hypothetical protein